MLHSRRLAALPVVGFVIVASMGLSGCAAGVGLTMLGIGAGTTASAGVNHTLGGIAYKTFTATPDDVHSAARNALGSMGITVEKDESDKETGLRHLAGRTRDREIDVEVEEVTPRTTRLRVVASQDVVFKDSATATEIIMQTAQALDTIEVAKARAAAAKASIKTASTRRKS
ncbi:MAG: hypothetical protein H7Y60_10755 [Rhodospirillaceae bacterium]|nr:hypothetical protein [Rhodospirillales bacterium]